MFKKLMAAAVLAIASMGVSAGTMIDTSGLSDAQIAEIKALAARKAAEAKNAAAPLLQDPGALAKMASTWGTQAAAAAEGFAKALAVAARELGVTINDFLNTPAGKLTAALIVWKVAGTAIMHALYGVFFVTVGLVVIRMFYMRLFTDRYEKVSYERFFGLWKGEKMVRVPKSFRDLNKDGEWLAVWMLLAIIGITVIGGGAFF